jgi:hypothetical protein
MPISGGAAHRHETDGVTIMRQCSCTFFITRALLYLWLKEPEISFCHTINHYKTSLYYKALYTGLAPNPNGEAIPRRNGLGL